MNSEDEQIKERDKMEQLNENLLYQWVLISGIVNNKRIIGKFSYNETVVLFLLSLSDDYVSLNELIKKTKILKSQMNRTITSLEDKQLVNTRISLKDKRKMEVSLTEKGREIQASIHATSIDFSDKIINIIGEDDAKKLCEIFQTIVKAEKEIRSYYE